MHDAPTSSTTPVLRAVRDPAVIAAWQALTTTWRRPHVLAQVGIAVAFVALVAAAARWELPILLGAALVLAMAELVLWAIVRMEVVGRMRCPHCGQWPAPYRGNVFRIDFCSKCHYWLR